MLKNYVISLKSANKRRQHITKEFSQQNVSFHFFEALMPSEQLKIAIRHFCPALENSSKLTDGEKACLISHITLWQKCIDENLPYIAIYEDDVYLSNDSGILLNNINWLEERFDDKAVVIRLEASWIPAEHYHCSIISKVIGREFLTLATTQHGTAAYIISNQAARILLQKCYALNEAQIQPFDHLLFDIWLNQPNYFICQLSPAIAIQADQHQQETNLTSQLQTARKERQNLENTPKYTLKDYFIRLLTKPKRQQEKQIYSAIEAYQKSRKTFISFK